MALDRQIDDLYQLPLGEFTGARNALAKTLGGADASHVKRLEKPTVVPWAVNQLYWRDRAAWDRLMKSGAALRTAQIAALEGKKADVRKASEAHRKSLAEAVERATQLAAEHDAKPGPNPLARMLEALSISAAPLPHPGRLTDVVQPAGFEALTGVTPKRLCHRRPDGWKRRPRESPVRNETTLFRSTAMPRGVPKRRAGRKTRRSPRRRAIWNAPVPPNRRRAALSRGPRRKSGRQKPLSSA